MFSRFSLCVSLGTVIIAAVAVGTFWRPDAFPVWLIGLMLVEVIVAAVINLRLDRHDWHADQVMSPAAVRRDEHPIDRLARAAVEGDGRGRRA